MTETLLNFTQVYLQYPEVIYVRSILINTPRRHISCNSSKQFIIAESKCLWGLLDAVRHLDFHIYITKHFYYFRENIITINNRSYSKNKCYINCHEMEYDVLSDFYHNAFDVNNFPNLLNNDSILK